MTSIADTILAVTEPDSMLEVAESYGKDVCEAFTDDTETTYTLGFLQDSTLLHPELTAYEQGFSAEPLPYMLWRDNWVTGTLMVSFILFVYLINHARRQFFLQANNFLYTPRNSDTPFVRDISFEPQVVMFMTLLLSLLGGFVMYIYSQYTFDLFLSLISPYLLLFVYTGCFLLYFLLKRIAYGFVNWVFFDKAQHKLWTDAYSFALSIECLLFYPAVLVSVYFFMSIQQILIMLCIILLYSKILLAYKCFSIFFPKYYCVIHFFSYLCALEIVPVIVLWKSLMLINGLLIIKY